MPVNDSDGREREIAVFCPVCCAFETVYIRNGELESARHWHIRNGSLYHRECGAPCRIFSESSRKLTKKLPAPIFGDGDTEDTGKSRLSWLMPEDENHKKRTSRY